MRSKRGQFLVVETPILLQHVHVSVDPRLFRVHHLLRVQVHKDRRRTQDNENRVLPVAQTEYILRVHAEPLYRPPLRFLITGSHGFRFIRFCSSSPLPPFFSDSYPILFSHLSQFSSPPLDHKIGERTVQFTAKTFYSS